jgi:hypothetical protein
MLKRKSTYILAAVLAPVAWLIFFSIDLEYDKKDDLGGGMTLISTTYVVRHPYWGMADTGGSFFIPFIPSSNSEMVRQRLVRNHTVLWEMNEVEIPGYRSYCAAVSPDRHYLLARQLGDNNFWRIHDLATGRYLELNVMGMRVPIGRHRHYNSFMFGHWSEDSKFVYAAEDGEEDHEGQQRSYREIYRIAAWDLNVEDQDHCHQKLDPRQEQLNWDNTPCAGSYK